jgi:CRISPR-associated protein Cmr4
MKQSLYYLHALSGIHAGTNQGIGVIDLPLARERASNLPLVPGSSIKGVLRDELRSAPSNDDYLALFGPEAGDNASEYAGALAVGDAKLLALPIRSWAGTFAWVTSPMILQRYQRDLTHAGVTNVPASIPAVQEGDAHHATTTVLLHSNNKIFLEDLDLNAVVSGADWAELIKQQFFADQAHQDWQDLFVKRFLIVSDSVFDFLAETATEIRARVKINHDTRTVQTGALWYEEYLPAETLLWGVVACDRSRKPSANHGGKPDPAKTGSELLKQLDNVSHLQIGGNATTGAGQVRWIKTGAQL